MEVEWTLHRCPATGPLLQACGIPLSVVVQPAGGCGSSRRAAPPHTSLLSGLARCRHCYAYINHLCELTDSSFVCSLCGRSTDIKSLTVWHNNYCRYPAARQHLPELQQQVYEVLVDPEPQEAAAATHDQQAAGQPSVLPVTLALVDAAGPDDFLDLVRGGLTVAMEALPRGSLFGLIGISDCITLVDMSGAGGPVLHHLPVLESSPVLVALEDVMPLHCLLVPVETAKRCLAQALELLSPDPMRTARAASSSSLQQPGMDRRPGQAATSAAAAAAAAAGQPMQSPQPQQQPHHSRDGLQPPCRAVGPTIQAVLEYLRALHTPHLASPELQQPGGSAPPGSLSGVAQLLLFLSGPPDIGIGKTVAMTAAGGGPGAGGRAAGAAAGGGRVVAPGAGDMSRQAQDMQLQYPVQDPQSKAFYDQAAVAAASMGIVVDVYAAARGYVGLQTLEPLVNSTGGALYLYPSAEEATLPQDLYRRLSTSKALCGMLRLRTCPQVTVSRCYGRLYQDGQYKDLFHIPCCDPGQAFVFDLEHTGSGIYNERFREATLQTAFQYSTVVPAGSSGLGGGGDGDSSGTQQQQQQQQGGGGGGPQYVVQRRLRVCTVRLPVAATPEQLYGSVDADTVLTVLTHKITQAVRSQSVGEARLLLRDWLVIFTTNFHRNSYMRASAAQLLKLPVDLTFSSCPLLQPLPRYVYALLRSPLLSSAAQYHSDLAAYLHHLWCALPPHELAKAVYCRLTAFADPDRMIATGLPLSRHSLQGPVLAEAAAGAARQAVAAAKKSSRAAGAAAADAPAAADNAPAAPGEEAVSAAAAGQGDGLVDPAAAAAAQSALSLSAAVAEGREAANILLLDAFILVLVLYRASAPAELPFPPPQDSLLWRAITEIKTERRVTTHVEVVRDGEDGSDLFYSLLIDDPDDLDTAPEQQQPQGGAAGGDGPSPSPTGVDQFIQHIKAEVVMQLQPH